MSIERLVNAIDRLERIIVELETLPPVPPPVAADEGDADADAATLREAYDVLEARHDALRARTGDGIAELDRLLNEPGRD